MEPATLIDMKVRATLQFNEHVVRNGDLCAERQLARQWWWRPDVQQTHVAIVSVALAVVRFLGSEPSV